MSAVSETTGGGAADAVAPDALNVENIDIAYRVRGRALTTVHDVSFRIGRGESYGLVGESGSGKSTIALAVVRYLARNGRVSKGAVAIDGRDVLAMRGEELRKLRANTVSMVYQEPGRALNPTIKVGRQVAEVFEIAGVDKEQSRERAEGMLEKVRIADRAGVMNRYPHQLSGGMLQRVVIAMALAAQPSLLILDEPTTALDATVEAEVLDLISALRDEFRTSLLFISHNLAVIAKMCDRVGVLYAGEMMETGPAREVFEDPRNPYTVGLLRCIPRRGTAKNREALDTIPGFPPSPGDVVTGCVFADRCGLVEDRCRTGEVPLYELDPAHPPPGPTRRSRCHFHERAQTLPRIVKAEPEMVGNGAGPREVLVSAEDVSKTFHMEGETIHGLVDVSLEVRAGETLGLVGESGSGKTTLARVLLGLLPPDQGATLAIEGTPLAANATQRTHAQQKALQIVFQNPDSALNRRHSIRRLLSRALSKLGGYRGDALGARLRALLAEVRLAERYLPMRPAQLSGGLKQRVAIARAFAGDPKIVVCDEPTSALDVSVQAAILNLLNDLQRREQVSYLFISHDLGVVRYLSDRIAVLYLGRLMETGSAEQVFNAPHHPYTEALLSAVPTLEDGAAKRDRIRLEGEIPSAATPPSGCVFHTRCPRFLGDVCVNTEPPLAESEPGHAIRCHIPLEELRRLQSQEVPVAGAGD
jgi:peptide/nickel transport system ATP-binding protein